MINLIIKGNMFDAFTASHQRGIALISATQMFNDRPSEVVASCGALSGRHPAFLLGQAIGRA
jgi:hypothetical protein